MSEDNKPTGFNKWVNDRFPLQETFEYHASKYYAPKNHNYLYLFGVFATVVLVLQIVSGIWLTMNYVPDEKLAFLSVEYIMRDIDWGWFIRYLHSTGASAFFAVVYMHMLRGMMYGSYKNPRELLWLLGMFLYLALMAVAFMGYLLPWGQMSYWGAQVIINLFSSIPFIGPDIAEWVRGDYVISGVTLNRFFALHVIALPLVIVFLVFLHLVALHHVGSNNPDGVEIKKHKDSSGKPLDGIPFFPYVVIKDAVALGFFFFVFFFIVFFLPEFFGLFLEAPNFEPANPSVTPEHIKPVWYFTAYYAMLRAVPSFFGSQFPATAVMFLAILLFFFLPWLDRSKVKSIRYKGKASKFFLLLFVISFVALTILGLLPADPIFVWLSRFFTLAYFAYFVLMPIYTSLEKTLPEPERITTHSSH